MALALRDDTSRKSYLTEEVPFEIRHEIYKYLLGTRGEISIGRLETGKARRLCNQDVHLSQGFLYSCTQIRDEFSRYIFSHSIFDLEDAADSVVEFLRNTPDRLLRAIRCVHYSHCNKLPLTDGFPRELKKLMTKQDQQNVKKCTTNFEEIFRLMTQKMTGLEALIIRLPIYSGRYHSHNRISQPDRCVYDPCPYLDTLSQVSALNIPYVSLRLFTVCADTHWKNRRPGLQCLTFTICGTQGRVEWMEDLMKGKPETTRKMTWRFLRPLLELKEKDDEDSLLFPADESCEGHYWEE